MSAMLRAFRKKYIGDSAFYRLVLAVAVPILIQNAITNFVSMLDNIMVGQVGTEQMSGVAIVNQLLFVYNLCIFGGLAGAGIFTAQYFGRGDQEGVRHTFRYKIILGLLVTGIATALLVAAGDSLISLYLQGEADGGDVGAALHWGREYLRVMLLGLPPFMAVQIYATTLRECSETVLPMKAGITAVLINLCFNYLLIYGKFGFPQLGVTGAAVATVIARYVEALIVVVWTHRHTDRNPWAKGVYRTLRVPRQLAWEYTVKGSPLLFNEALWSIGQSFLVQCYSVRGLNVIAAQNIANTFGNLFMIAFFTMGSAVSIIVGQLLGAGRMEEAKDKDNKLIFTSMLIALGVAVVYYLAAPLFPQLYNTTDAVRSLATRFMRTSCFFMVQMAFLHTTYFTLRAGGRTVITFFFDCGSTWVLSVPIAFCLTRFTNLDVIWVYALVMMGDWIKCALGYVLLRRNVWLRNIVESH